MLCLWCQHSVDCRINILEKRRKNNQKRENTYSFIPHLQMRAVHCFLYTIRHIHRINITKSITSIVRVKLSLYYYITPLKVGIHISKEAAEVSRIFNLKYRSVIMNWLSGIPFEFSSYLILIPNKNHHAKTIHHRLR